MGMDGDPFTRLGRDQIIAPQRDPLDYTEMMLLQVRSAPTNTGWRSVLVTFLLVVACGGLTIGYYAIKAPPTASLSLLSARSSVAAGDRLFASGDYTLSIEQYTAAISKAPDYVPAYYKRAEAYKAGGDRKSAVADLRTALQLIPDEPGRSQIEDELKALGER